MICGGVPNDGAIVIVTFVLNHDIAVERQMDDSLLGFLAIRIFKVKIGHWICVKSFLFDNVEEHHQDLCFCLDSSKPS